jgi:hypothetical protein
VYSQADGVSLSEAKRELDLYSFVMDRLSMVCPCGSRQRKSGTSSRSMID